MGIWRWSPSQWSDANTHSCERASVLTGVLYLYEGVGQDGGVGCWWDSLRWLRGGESWGGEGGAALGFLPLLPLPGWWWWWWEEGVTRACNRNTHQQKSKVQQNLMPKEKSNLMAGILKKRWWMELDVEQKKNQNEGMSMDEMLFFFTIT